MVEMTGYRQITLSQMVDELGTEAVKGLLSSFSCPLNQDVEQFLRYKAIEFAKQEISATHLVYTAIKASPYLWAYYTLTNKIFTVRSTARLSAKLRSRLSRFARHNQELHQYELSIQLIGQLGRNSTNHYDALITGAELLEMASERIRVMQMCAGGKFAYLECADIPALVRFYERNGFVFLDTRT